MDLLDKAAATVVHLHLTDLIQPLEGCLDSFHLALQRGALPNMQTLVLEGMQVVEPSESIALTRIAGVLSRRAVDGVFRRLELMNVTGVNNDRTILYGNLIPEVECFEGTTALCTSSENLRLGGEWYIFTLILIRYLLYATPHHRCLPTGTESRQ